MRNAILFGDCLEQLKRMPASCVQTCVTSPPYYGLRDYGATGQIGIEPTPELYVSNLVEVFREVRRVLRDDGTLWLNVGDSYANDLKWGGSTGGKHAKALHGNTGVGRGRRATGLAPKNLIGIPWMTAFALRADGWLLRSEVIWHKPNAMPEPVQDRPTRSHEHVFLLAKGPTYFYDHLAVQEKALSEESGKRNRRSVWSINTQAYKAAHFAVMAPELAATCIKAGTSEAGACSKCGASFGRHVKLGAIVPSGKNGRIHTNDYRDLYSGLSHPERDDVPQKGARGSGFGKYEREFVGWVARCTCADAERVPCVVLDPFTGSGTTPMVALDLDRDYLGIELNESYGDLIEERLRPARDAAGQRAVARVAFYFDGAGD